MFCVRLRRERVKGHVVCMEEGVTGTSNFFSSEGDSEILDTSLMMTLSRRATFELFPVFGWRGRVNKEGGRTVGEREGEEMEEREEKDVREFKDVLSFPTVLRRGCSFSFPPNLKRFDANDTR